MTVVYAIENDEFYYRVTEDGIAGRPEKLEYIREDDGSIKEWAKELVSEESSVRYVDADDLHEYEFIFLAENSDTIDYGKTKDISLHKEWESLLERLKNNCRVSY